MLNNSSLPRTHLIQQEPTNKSYNKSGIVTKISHHFNSIGATRIRKVRIEENIGTVSANVNKDCDMSIRRR